MYGQSAVGRVVGIATLTTIIFFICGIVYLIRYLLAMSKRKAMAKLLEEAKQTSANGKRKCIHCGKFTDTEKNIDGIFCAECGWERK